MNRILLLIVAALFAVSILAGCMNNPTGTGSLASGSASENASSGLPSDHQSAEDSISAASDGSSGNLSSGGSEVIPSDTSSGTSNSSSSSGSASGYQSGSSSSASVSEPETLQSGFRGVFFNPRVVSAGMEDFPYLLFDTYESIFRDSIRQQLQSLSDEAKINYICMFIAIPYTLKSPPKGNVVGQTIEEWANLTYLDNLVLLIEDCHDAGISIEFDLADNRWIPYAIDSDAHIGKPGDKSWPMADYSPWNESAEWYSQIIEYIESKTKYPESIAMWCMNGNYTLGGAEPVLWDNEYKPDVLIYTEKYIKRVWPVFMAAGKRPKGAPYAFPILSNNSYWMPKTTAQRLAGFTNLKKWLVDDLKLPPDYWIMSTYPYCDPAPDGIYYLKEIVKILGKENASRLLSTDFKSIGINLAQDSIITTGTHSEADRLAWNFAKCKEYGFAGWWIWSYQDSVSYKTGIRDIYGVWKTDLVQVIKAQAPE